MRTELLDRKTSIRGRDTFENRLSNFPARLRGELEARESSFPLEMLCAFN